MRPNKLDWLIYRFFYWWWNPIFEKNQTVTIAFIVFMCVWVEKHWGIVMLDPKMKEFSEEEKS